MSSYGRRDLDDNQNLPMLAGFGTRDRVSPQSKSSKRIVDDTGDVYGSYGTTTFKLSSYYSGPGSALQVGPRIVAPTEVHHY